MSQQLSIIMAKVNEKYYWFHIDLFGPICQDKTVYFPRGQYFEIKLEKYLKGYYWPRLTLINNRLPWLKLISHPTTMPVMDLFPLQGRKSKNAKQDSYEEGCLEGGPPECDIRSDSDSDTYLCPDYSDEEIDLF